MKTYELELWYGNPKFPRKSNELGGDETVAQYLAIENNKMQAELEKQASAVSHTELMRSRFSSRLLRHTHTLGLLCEDGRLNQGSVD